jgi:uncharacterized protein YecT (DUF1311 family)
MKSLFLALAIFTTEGAMADNCDKPRDDFDGLYCLNKIYMKADEDLNDSFRELRALLNPEEKKALIKTQLQWIETRNSTCSLKNSTGFFVNLSCVTKTTIERTNTLRDRIRECKATGCQSSKL